MRAPLAMVSFFVKVRFIWSKIDHDQARWEQAFSYDDRSCDLELWSSGPGLPSSGASMRSCPGSPLRHLREQSEFVLERVSQAAISAGAPPAPKDCRANFYIAVTAEPGELQA